MSGGDMGGEAVRRKAPRWMVAALVASLALNFIVIGSVAGAMWRFKGPPGGGGVVPNLLGYASTLPSERRKEIWDLTARERSEIRPVRREVRAAREETTKALMAEPFDKQAFLEAQTRQAEAENRARAAVQNLFAEIASNMTAAERKAFAGWREHRRPPGQNLLDEPDPPTAAK